MVPFCVTAPPKTHPLNSISYLTHTFTVLVNCDFFSPSCTKLIMTLGNTMYKIYCKCAVKYWGCAGYYVHDYLAVRFSGEVRQTVHYNMQIHNER